MDKMDENFEWFKKNHKELYTLYPNKYIVIVDKIVVGNFANMEDAFKFAMRNHENDVFNILHCTQNVVYNNIKINTYILGLWEKT